MERILDMQCPNCRDKDLYRVLTRQGVEVDYCKECGGIWLDKGEIYYFTKTPAYLKHNIEEALKNQRISEKISPKTKQPLVSITLFDTLIVEFCPKTGGIWLDKGELEKLPSIEKKSLDITLDKKIEIEERVEIDIEEERKRKERISAIEARISPLPNLIVASTVTLAGLYALLTLILILCVQFLGLSPFFALIIGILVVLFHFLFGPFLLDLSLSLFFKLSWIRSEQLPLHLKNFIERICKEKNMRFPRMGLIRDGSPQAFTYGHHPNNARVVISQGLINLLDEREAEAVVAHELGHAKHWDMLIMTLAQLVPLVSYYIYRTLIRVRTRERDRGAGARYLIAIGSYILYIISEYLVLWFSRIREYFADRFSGEVTQDPNVLASALVKIGYGLAGQKLKVEKEERRPQLEVRYF
ncbi:MAG: M48 family metalloprotease [Candidatus Omnitrophica bacterium]|nr:M48 family metalloprotease [Candidatus Omnitrophota bacterium]